MAEAGDLHRDDHVRQDGRDRRGVRAYAVDVHAVGLPEVGRHGADHDRNATRRSGCRRRLRGVARWTRPQAEAHERPRAAGLARHGHSRPDPREDRVGPQPLAWAPAGHEGGYIGDAPPYQGHVVAIDAGSGHIAHVWNSLCSDRHSLIVPSTCAGSDSAIWGRGGAVVEPGSGRLLVATGNAPFDGKD